MSELILTQAVPPQWETAYAALLRETGLHDEHESDCTVLLTESERLLGCGSLAGKVLKQIAVSPDVQGQDACARIVTALTQQALRQGIVYPFLFTKPEHKRLFAALGFFPLAQTPDMLMMTRQKNGLARFLAAIPVPEGGQVGCVVCHANPFTRGHLSLITAASEACRHVLVFVLSDEVGLFPHQVRLDLVRQGTAHLPNVSVYSGGDYLLSVVTLPAYFLKDPARIDAARCAMDLTLFGESVAPALHITRRFVGQEPFCPVTAVYNECMKQMLPPLGVEVCELPRYRGISATAVRQLIQTGRLAEIAPLVPEVTYDYCRRHFG